MLQDWQEVEEAYLAPWAAHSRDSAGRDLPEAACPLRTVYQRDRDRIIHCKAFRRLKHKTQVFINPEGDHFRTRLTHTLEVSQIARTIARALHLNEDLTEAIALGHDLGHTPFGHAGERALNRLTGHFSHNEQSLRVVEVLERDGRGLNLTREVRDGILHHSGGETLPKTLEGQVVRYCDRIAYLNHDIDDAVRSGYLEYHQLPVSTLRDLGEAHSQRINTMVLDIVRESSGKAMVHMSAPIAQAMNELRAFMFSHVYLHPRKTAEEKRLEQVIDFFFSYYQEHPELLPDEYQKPPLQRSVCDYIAGMTDTFALSHYAELRGYPYESSYAAPMSS